MGEQEELHRIKTVEGRQSAFRKLVRTSAPNVATDGLIFDFGTVDPEVYARSCESLIGQVSIPVGVIGPLTVHYREYEEDDTGELIEGGNVRTESVFIPMATHEGGLNASLNRGIKAANLCGGVSTYVLRTSMTRGSCYVFETTEQAYRFSRWLPGQLTKMQRWLEDPDNPFRNAELSGVPLLSRHARLRRVDTYLLSNTCHAVFSYSTGDACGQNMTTRNTYVLHSHFILPQFHTESDITPAHFFLEANAGGDKKSSHLYHIHGGHGRTVIASVVLVEDALTATLKCSVDEILKLREVGGEGAALSGMIGMSVNPANVIAAIFAATGQDLACVGTSSMAIMSATECPDGIQCTLRLPNLEVGTVGGGTGLPHQSRYLEMMGCRLPQSANKFAQIVTAAAICLELSTGGAMAAAGSISFYTAHLERGGMKRVRKPAQVSPVLVDRLREGESK